MDFSSVKNQVVIVTGASQGIGEAIAKCYAEHGMKVVCANRNEEKGKRVADEIKEAGGGVCEDGLWEATGGRSNGKTGGRNLREIGRYRKQCRNRHGRKSFT